MDRSVKIGPFGDPEKYLRKLSGVVQNLVDSPNDIKQCLRIRKDNQNRVLGWEIEERKFIFKNRKDFIKIIERAENSYAKTYFYLHSFSYHFEPADIDCFMRFRVDLDNISLHGNPDERFSSIAHLCHPKDIKLMINEYNALAAIFVALTYLNTWKYPFDNKYADTYNEIICNVLGGKQVG